MPLERRDAGTAQGRLLQRLGDTVRRIDDVVVKKELPVLARVDHYAPQALVAAAALVRLAPCRAAAGAGAPRLQLPADQRHPTQRRGAGTAAR